MVMRNIRKLAYSFGAVATALSYQAFSAWILFFYVDVKKLTPMLAGIAMILYGIWNAVNDPLAGYISDRTRTKWGRRIPYIAIGAIPFGIIYYLIWSPPFDANQMIWLFVYFILIINLFDTFYTFVILNWASLFPEMFPSLKERAEVNSFRQFFGVIGLMIGIALTPLIYSSIGWSGMGILYGGIIVLSLFVSLLGSREKREFSLDKSLGVKDAVLKSLKNRSFLTFVVSNLFVQYTFTMVLAILPFFAKYLLGVGERETFMILITAFIFEIPMLFIWGKAAVRFGAKPIYLTAIACFGIFLIPFLVINDVVGSMIISAFLGASLGGVIVLSDVVISDIIDEDEIMTGTRREGMYFGVNAFVTRFAIALEGASVWLIFTLTHYDAALKAQPVSFNYGLRLLIALFPFFSMLLAFIIMRYYPLAGARLKQLKESLEKIHLEKAKKVA
jgi:GPH family glycoside/pentoside/hexuronide:cation symporter